jgi:hypothetical protein
MDIAEAAAYLSISSGSFANAGASEGIPKHYFTGRKPKFSRQGLETHMAPEAVGTSLLPLPYHNPVCFRAVSRVFAPDRHGEKPPSVC